MHKRRIYKAHPNCGWRASWSFAYLSRFLSGARPGCTTPQIRWTCVHPAVKRDTSPCIFGLSKIPDYERGASSRPRLATTPLPFLLASGELLTLGSANTWYRDFHPDSYVPCLAHTVEFTGAISVRWNDLLCAGYAFLKKC